MTQNLKKTIYWIIADVKILPNAPNWTKDADKALVQIVTRLGCSRGSAEKELQEKLLPLGYEFLSLEEFTPFDDIVWPSDEIARENRKLYRKFLQNERTEQLQFGKFSFYDEDEQDAE